MKKVYNLPIVYILLTWQEKRAVREQYIEEQEGKCYYCESSLDKPPPASIQEKKIDWSLFPPGFLEYPIHLQHNHKTGLTEGAIHSYCNAVMWQYENR